MKALELRELTDEELAVKLEDMKRDFLNFRFAQTTQQLEKPHELRKIRRNIARLNTIVSERKNAKDVQPSS